MVDEVQIESGIPIPPIRRRGGKARHIPWNEMFVGDSIFIATAWPTGNFTVHASKTTGFKFTTRIVDGGMRIWRIK